MGDHQTAVTTGSGAQQPSLVCVRQCELDEIAHAPNAHELFEQYAQESANPALGSAVVQVQTYRELESMGLLRCLGAFEGQTLVGFLVIVLTVLPHYGAKVGVGDAIFVSKAARKAGAGLRMMRMAEGLVLEAGAQGVMFSAPNHTHLGKVLERTGYEPFNTIYYRGLA